MMFTFGPLFALRG